MTRTQSMSLAAMAAAFAVALSPQFLVAQSGPRPVKPAYDDGNVEALRVKEAVLPDARSLREVPVDPT